jgi:hypothetical protein
MKIAFANKFVSFFIALIVSLVLITSPLNSYADIKQASDIKLYNGLSGIKFLAQAGALKTEHLDTFIQAQKDTLKDKGLYDKLLAVKEKLDTLNDCNKQLETQSLSDDVTGLLFRNLELCGADNNISFDSLLDLTSKVDGIVADLNKEQNKFSKEDYQKLAKEIYQRQRAMYVGSSFIAYKKYFDPTAMLDTFMQNWRYDKTKEPYQSNGEFKKAGNGLSEIDDFYRKDLESRGDFIAKEFPDPNKNIEELSLNATKNLQLVGSRYEVLQTARSNQYRYEEQLKSAGLLVAPEQVINIGDHDLKARDEIFYANPFTQPFRSFELSNVGAPRRVLDFTKIQDEIRAKEQQRLRNLSQVEQSSELAFMVSYLERTTNQKILVIDDQFHQASSDPKKQVELKVLGSPSSPLLRFNQDFDPEVYSGFDRQMDQTFFEEGYRYAPDLHIKETRVIPVSKIWEMYYKAMSAPKVRDSLLRKNGELRSVASYHQGRHEEAKARSLSDDTALYMIGAGQRKVVDPWFEPARLEFKSSGRHVNPELGIRLDEQLQPSDVRDKVKLAIEASAELMAHMDNMYNKHINGDPEEFIKKVTYYHPAVAMKVIGSNAKYAGMLCMLAKQKITDDLEQAERDRIFKKVALWGGIIFAVATLGTGAVALFGVGVGIAAKTAMVGAAVGFGLGASGATLNGMRSSELDQQLELEQSLFNATGEVKGDEVHSRLLGLHDKAKDHFYDAVLSGVFAIVDLKYLSYGAQALKAKNGADALKVATSTKEGVIAVVEEGKALSLAEDLRLPQSFEGEPLHVVARADHLPDSVLGAKTLRSRQAREADLLSNPKRGKDYVEEMKANAALEDVPRLEKIENVLSDKLVLNGKSVPFSPELKEDLLTIHRKGELLEHNSIELSQKITDAQKAIAESTGIVLHRKVIEERLVRTGLLGKSKNAAKTSSANPTTTTKLKEEQHLGTKVEMSEELWEKHYKGIRATMKKGEDPATVNRSEWKGKFSDEKAFEYLQKQYKSFSGEDFPLPAHGDYKKAVEELAERIRMNTIASSLDPQKMKVGLKTEITHQDGAYAFELTSQKTYKVSLNGKTVKEYKTAKSFQDYLKKKFGSPLKLRDPPPPAGAKDSTFTYYTKTLVDPKGGKHQFRVRTYVRSIDPLEMKPGVIVEAYNNQGKFLFEKLPDGHFKATLNDKEFGIYKNAKDFKAAFNDNLQFYAPHGKKFKLEVKSRSSDAVDIDDYEELSGQVFVQKFSIDLSEKEVFAIFNSTQPLEEIKAVAKANPKNSPERVDAIFDLFSDAQKLDPDFRTLSGSTEYKRYAFSVSVPDQVGGSTVPLQTTMDYDMGIRSVYSSDGSLLTPMETMKGTSNLKTPADANLETFHIELKSPKDLVERSATNPEEVSVETLQAMENFVRGNTITNRGKFHHIDQQKAAHE